MNNADLRAEDFAYWSQFKCECNHEIKIIIAVTVAIIIILFFVKLFFKDFFKKNNN